MKPILLIISFFICNTVFCQVDNFNLLTKGIDSSNIKTITKFRESKKFPNGEKKFKLEFNQQGKLVSIEEYEYTVGPDNPLVMRQEIRYDNEGKKMAIYIIAPDAKIAIDTLMYNNKGELIKKQRVVNGQVVKTWEYSDKTIVDQNKKEFDKKGNLIKTAESETEFTTYKYDSNGNLEQEIQFNEGKEHIKNIYEYNKNSRLIKMNTYLLYIGDGTNKPLTYYFEYEEYK